MPLKMSDIAAGLTELKTHYPFISDSEIVDETLLARFEDKTTYFKQLLSKNLGQEQASNGIKELAYMVDCSRNAVPQVATLKQLIRLLALTGYHVLMLYMEDVFEVDDEPYFGYLRGRYSKSELKEVVAYADLFGIEVVPCIQTLAHYNQLTRWYEHLGVFDVADILLVGEPRMQLLIERIFKTLRECFTTKRINIGMDEAYLLGRGKYFDRHGGVARFDIMKQQLAFVDGLCQKYDFKPMMWSDMFFRLAFDNYYDVKGELPEEVTAMIAGKFDLVYWDYYHVDVDHYRKMMDIHLALKTNIYFAGGAWKWSGFTPDNRFSINTLTAGMQAASEKKLDLFIVTAWGDNGGESSLFSVLPALVYSALLRDNQASKDNLNRVMSLLSGLRWNEYLLIDSANRGFREDHVDVTNTTNKTMLFNDPLLGVMDSLATFIEIDNYQMYKEKIATIPYQHSPFDYVFDVQVALLDVLALKADLGLRLRKAYQAGDKKALSHIAEQLPLLVKRLDVFSSKLHKQWHRENKPHGFDVQDLRLGGLKERLRVTSQKLNAYLAGSLTSIEELDEEILDYMCQGKEYTFDTRNCEYRLHRISSVNVND